MTNSIDVEHSSFGFHPKTGLCSDNTMCTNIVGILISALDYNYSGVFCVNNPPPIVIDVWEMFCLANPKFIFYANMLGVSIYGATY